MKTDFKLTEMTKENLKEKPVIILDRVKSKLTKERFNLPDLYTPEAFRRFVIICIILAVLFNAFVIYVIFFR